METRILNNELERFVLKLEDRGIDPCEFLQAFIDRRRERKDKPNNMKAVDNVVSRSSVAGLRS